MYVPVKLGDIEALTYVAQSPCETLGTEARHDTGVVAACSSPQTRVDDAHSRVCKGFFRSIPTEEFGWTKLGNVWAPIGITLQDVSKTVQV